MQISELWGLQGMKDNSIYLINTLIMVKNRRKKFNKLKDRVQTPLEGWQSKLLSKAGKATLIKAVVQDILVYTMSTFKISKGKYKDLYSMVRRFW